MLRRLRQPENLALIVAWAALVIALIHVTVIIGTRRTFSFYPLHQTILYWLYLSLSNSTLWLILVTFISCLLLSAALWDVKSTHPQPFPFRWFWGAILLACGFCATTQFGGYALALATLGAAIVLLIAAATTRHPKIGGALLIMLVALICSIIALIGQTFFDYNHINSVSIDSKAYALGVRHEGDDFCYQHSYHIFECDSIYMVCQLQWSSNLECRRDPTVLELRVNNETNRLTLQVDDETFEIPLEP